MTPVVEGSASTNRQHRPVEEPAARGPVLIIMGVAGSGKSTIGRGLADALGGHFLDADDFHSLAAIDQMRAGVPLDDADRMPWLERVGRAAATWRSPARVIVIACSALRRSYRDVLRRELPGATFIHLVSPSALIQQRLLERSHFMHPALLWNQLEIAEDLQPDEAGIVVVTIDETVEQTVALTRARLGS